MTTLQRKFIALALIEARLAGKRGEIPVGAVVVRGTELVAKAGNRNRELLDPSGHAEILAMRAACTILGSHRLWGCDLYVTLEPCVMCAGAISFARIAKLHYSADDPKGGGVINGIRFFDQPTCHHQPAVIKVPGEKSASQLLKRFFTRLRLNNHR